MTKLKMRAFRIECEEITLADGSTVFVCVTCETWAEAHHARPLTMMRKPLARRRMSTLSLRTRHRRSR